MDVNIKEEPLCSVEEPSGLDFEVNTQESNSCRTYLETVKSENYMDSKWCQNYGSENNGQMTANLYYFSSEMMETKCKRIIKSENSDTENLSVKAEPAVISKPDIACFECKASLKSTVDKRNISKHKRNLTADWQLCQFCDYKTKNKYSFRQHIKDRHTKAEEWHQCQLCDFVTKNKRSLYNHVSVKHKDSAESYQCRFCDYKTSYKYHLIRHFKRRHDQQEEYYQCDLCEYKMKERSYLVRHIKLKHADIISASET